MFALRNPPPDLWAAFTTKAKADGWPLRALFLALMTAYVQGKISPDKSQLDKPNMVS